MERILINLTALSSWVHWLLKTQLTLPPPGLTTVESNIFFLIVKAALFGFPDYIQPKTSWLIHWCHAARNGSGVLPVVVSNNKHVRCLLHHHQDTLFVLLQNCLFDYKLAFVTWEPLVTNSTNDQMLETKANSTFKAVEICLYFYDDLFLLLFLGPFLLDRHFQPFHMHSFWLSLLSVRLSEDFFIVFCLKRHHSLAFIFI